MFFYCSINIVEVSVCVSFICQLQIKYILKGNYTNKNFCCCSCLEKYCPLKSMNIVVEAIAEFQRIWNDLACSSLLCIRQ